MPFYLKKRIMIEAKRFNGCNGKAIERWSNGSVTTGVGSYEGRAADILRVQTAEGVRDACPGDWIIKGVNGEFYPCKPDIFTKTYDPAPEGETPA